MVAVLSRPYLRTVSRCPGRVGRSLRSGDVRGVGNWYAPGGSMTGSCRRRTRSTPARPLRARRRGRDDDGQAPAARRGGGEDADERRAEEPVGGTAAERPAAGRAAGGEECSACGGSRPTRPRWRSSPGERGRERVFPSVYRPRRHAAFPFSPCDFCAPLLRRRESGSQSVYVRVFSPLLQLLEADEKGTKPAKQLPPPPIKTHEFH